MAILQIISAEQRSSKHWELTGEGQETAEKGSHEARVYNAIPEEGLPQSELMVSAMPKTPAAEIKPPITATELESILSFYHRPHFVAGT